MKILGQVLLWIGFLAGSFATVYHLPKAGVEHVKGLTQEDVDKAGGGFQLQDLSEVEVPEEGWNLVPWNWYIAGVAVAVFGVMLLYASRMSTGVQTDKTKANLKEIKGHLDDVIVELGKLIDEQDKLAPSQITEYIDNELADDLRAFADGRDSITAEYNLTVFAEVMTEFAAGERAINRAWSAAADGYVDEVRTCLDRADLCLKRAKEELASAKA